MISVVIPLYNKEPLIEATLRSVLRQTYQDFEIVVVNDGSTDGSAQAAARVSDPRIRIITQDNAGVSAARNRGIAEARGEFVALLDADDEWYPDYLETQVWMSEKYSSCSVFATNYLFRYPDGASKASHITHLPFAGTTGILSNYFQVAANSNPPLWTSSIMARKSALQKVGGFPTGVRSGEDLITWARLACQFSIAYCTSEKAIYNIPAYDKNNPPKRRMEKQDIVGDYLSELRASHPDVPFFDLYISHWHKMRASVAMRHGEVRETFSEIFKCLRANYKNLKAIAFGLIVILPASVRRHILGRYL